jgi:hypothetical protein
VLRFAFIKTKMPGYQKRAVVAMNVCLGNSSKLAQFNLANRSHFRYQVLIGRNLLKHNYLVNSSAKHIANPKCKSPVASITPAEKPVRF